MRSRSIDDFDMQTMDMRPRRRGLLFSDAPQAAATGSSLLGNTAGSGLLSGVAQSAAAAPQGEWIGTGQDAYFKPGADPFANSSQFGGTRDESWRNTETMQPGTQWIAEQPSNQAAMLGGAALKPFGFSGPTTTYANGNTSAGDNFDPGQQLVNPAFNDWLKSQNFTVSPDWSTQDGMTTSLKDAGGKTLTSQSSGNDDTFWKAAMAAAAVTGAGVYGAQAGIGGVSAGAVDSAALGLDGAAGFGGAEAGGGALGLEGATYAMPGAESGFSLANTGAAAESATPGVFNAAVDSQLANAQLGIGVGDIAAMAPKTVNLGSLGGTMATAGGLTGAANVASQGLLDATASGQIGGTAASQLGQAAAGGLGTAASVGGDVASFLKSNPTLGRLLFGGALAAINTSGNSNGSAPGASSGGSYGAPAQWTAPASALNAGLLGANQKQVLPPAMTGLLGNANSGAWRWGK